MPHYEYACDSCGYQFTLEQRMSDPPVEKCPRCEGKVKKLLSGGVGVIVKGGGGSSAPMPPCASGGSCCAPGMDCGMPPCMG